MDSETKANIQEQMSEMDVQFGQRARQDEGWFGTYVECPDCEVPFARVTTEAQSADLDEQTSISKSTHIGVCPSCHARQVKLTVEQVVGPVQ